MNRPPPTLFIPHPKRPLPNSYQATNAVAGPGPRTEAADAFRIPPYNDNNIVPPRPIAPKPARSPAYQSPNHLDDEQLSAGPPTKRSRLPSESTGWTVLPRPTYQPTGSPPAPIDTSGSDAAYVGGPTAPRAEREAAARRGSDGSVPRTTSVPPKRPINSLPVSNNLVATPMRAIEGRRLVDDLVRTIFAHLSEAQDAAQLHGRFGDVDGPEGTALRLVATKKADALQERLDNGYHRLGDALYKLVYSCVDENSFGRIDKLERHVARLEAVVPRPTPPAAVIPEPTPPSATLSSPPSSMFQDERYELLEAKYSSLATKYDTFEASIETRFAALQEKLAAPAPIPIPFVPTPIDVSEETMTLRQVAASVAAVERAMVTLKTSSTILRKTVDQKALQLEIVHAQLDALQATIYSSRVSKAESEEGEDVAPVRTVMESIEILSKIGELTSKGLARVEEEIRMTRDATEQVAELTTKVQEVENQLNDMDSRTMMLEGSTPLSSAASRRHSIKPSAPPSTDSTAPNVGDAVGLPAEDEIMHLWSKVTALSSKVEATMVLVQTMRGNDSVNQVFEQLKAVRTRVTALEGGLTKGSFADLSARSSLSVLDRKLIEHIKSCTTTSSTDLDLTQDVDDLPLTGSQTPNDKSSKKVHAKDNGNIDLTQDDTDTPDLSSVRAPPTSSRDSPVRKTQHSGSIINGSSTVASTPRPPKPKPVPIPRPTRPPPSP